MRKWYGLIAAIVFCVIFIVLHQSRYVHFNDDVKAIETNYGVKPPLDDCGVSPWGSATEHKDIVFSHPIRISRGGIYQGNWLSPSWDIPAVTIDTTEPVIIRNSIITGYSDLIVGHSGSVRIENTKAYGLGKKPGKFVMLRGKGTYEFNENYIQNLWGIKIEGIGPGQYSGTYSFVGNTACNIKEGIDSKAHFIQIANGYYINSSIVNNYAVNIPGYSQVEDVLSLFDSGGVESSPVEIYGNVVLGAYPPDPVMNGFSGGGIIADGGGLGSAELISRYINIHDNCIVSTTNYGIAIASGNHISIEHNLIISSGLDSLRRPLKAQNIGLYIWDIYREGEKIFNNNRSNANIIFWRKQKTDGSRAELKNDWVPDCRSLDDRLTCGINNYAKEPLSDAKALGIENKIRLQGRNCNKMIENYLFLLGSEDSR